MKLDGFQRNHVVPCGILQCKRRMIFWHLVFDLDSFSLSEIYSKVAQNTVVQARPAVIHFGGFELGKTMKQKLFVSNVSSEVQRYHIIPPQSKYFNIKYTKNVSHFYGQCHSKVL